MEPSDTSAPIRLPASGVQRLVLAVSAAGAVVTLCWAALQVRTARDEARLAREAGPAKPAPAASPAPGDLSGRIAGLEQELTEEKSRAHQFRQEAGAAAARIAELEKVIAFLRQENDAAQKTIERLSSLEPPSTPENNPVQTNTLNKSRDR